MIDTILIVGLFVIAPLILLGIGFFTKGEPLNDYQKSRVCRHGNHMCGSCEYESDYHNV